MKDRMVVSYNPVVAQKYGRSAAIFLSQLQFWLGKKPHTIDGKKWVYNTYDEWSAQTGVPTRTLKRVVVLLRREGILYTAKHNLNIYYQTLWYSINEKKLAENSIVPNGPRIVPNGTPIVPNGPIYSSNSEGTSEEDTSESKLMHKGKSAEEVLAKLQKEKTAPIPIEDSPSVSYAKMYWRKMYKQKFALAGVLPPLTQKEHGEFKHLVTRCEGKAGILLRRIFEDWSGCRHHVELVAGKKLPLYPDVGVVLSHLTYILNWSLKEHESVQLVSTVVKPKAKEAVPKEKPIWLEE